MFDFMEELPVSSIILVCNLTLMKYLGNEAEQHFDIMEMFCTLKSHFFLSKAWH